jgi:hypothetical protein
MNTPAFPSARALATASGVMTEGRPGMSLRDYFAAKAMQSVLDGSWPDLQLKPKDKLTPVENSALFAYEIADAMMKAREGGAA